MSKYPTINFIGNKRQLTTWISELYPVRHGIALDIFSGGGSVSYALKEMGLQVISNDCLYSNYVLSKAFIENDNCILSKDVFNSNIDRVDVDNCLDKIQFLSSNLYFDYELPELARLIAISYTLDGYEKYLFLSLLRRSMIRKLPYSRMNISWEKIVQLRDEQYSYENYGRKRAYHNESFTKHMLDEIEQYNQAVFSNGLKCTSFNLDSIEMVKNIDYVDSVYLDPPYPSTLNNYDAFYGQFDIIFDKECKRKTDFTSKKTFCKNMGMLLDEIKDKTNYIVLSINTRVSPSYTVIFELLKEYGKCEVFSKNHNYQLTSKQNKSSSKELLMIVDTSNS